MHFAVHLYLILVTSIDGASLVEPVDLAVDLGDLTFEGHRLRNDLEGLVFKMAHEVDCFFCNFNTCVSNDFFCCF